MNLHVDGATKGQFKFNEITSITGVKPYVLRFWESEFDQIQPQVNELGQKYYSQSDLDAISKIKKLLFDEKLSIPQAKGYLDREMIIDDCPEEDISLIEVQANELKIAINERANQIEQSVDNKVVENSELIEKDINVKTEETLVSTDRLIPDQMQEKAQLIADEIRNDVSLLRAFRDSDVVSLVSAKKKLCSLVARIDVICKQHNWS